MNGCCREVIEPSVKLGRMITLLKIVVVAHFILLLVDFFLIETGFIFFLVQILVLLIAISSKHFSYFLIFILICIFNFEMIFESMGAWFQIGFYKNDSLITFFFFSFMLVFEIFSIYVVFQVYKQSKQEYREKYGYAAGENVGGENIENFQDFNENNLGINFQNNNDGNDNNNNGNNNNEGFVPFEGRGVAVGGN